MSETDLLNRVLVLGGGPAGLTAAYQLSGAGVPAVLVERDPVVGGLARTVSYKGFRFDIGGHRFFTKVPEVQEIWHELLGGDLLTRPRLSRIYYRNRFFDYPLKLLNALQGLGFADTTRVLLSYLHAKAFPSPKETSFEEWVCNRFGRALYTIFFKTYTEKVWGIPCTDIGSEWAAQRIQNLSLGAAIWRAAFPKANDQTVRTLIDHFHYPRLGPGQMWERCRDVVHARGCPVLVEREVVQIRHEAGRVITVTTRDSAGQLQEMDTTQVISSMALPDVLGVLEPRPPSDVLTAARRLRYRDFLTVCLIVDRAQLFPDNWIYVHSPEVRLGRVQNYKNWSQDMVPDLTHTALGLEYFVQENDDLWRSSDEALLRLGVSEAALLGLVSPAEVSDGTVVRMRRAYPIYSPGYQSALETIRHYLATLPNLQQVGRNGQHRYNNQDHSMLTAMLAVRNLLGEHHDIWQVNTGGEYHELPERAQPVPIRPVLVPSGKGAEETL